jgi:ketosteroid isomerase-like protein
MEILKKWHQAIATRDLSMLDEILADDVTFYPRTGMLVSSNNYG